MTFERIESAEEAPQQTSEIQLILSMGLNEEDAEDVLNLASKCQNFTPEDLMIAEEAAWEAAFSTGIPHRVFIKTHTLIGDEQQLIGFACFGRISNENDFYELYLLAVEDSYQELGIGTALLDEVERQVAMYEGNMIFCEMSEHRSFAPIHSFFEKNNYEKQFHYYRFFTPTTGNLVYAKKVENQDEFGDIYES